MECDKRPYSVPFTPASRFFASSTSGVPGSASFHRSRNFSNWAFAFFNDSPPSAPRPWRSWGRARPPFHSIAEIEDHEALRLLLGPSDNNKVGVLGLPQVIHATDVPVADLPGQAELIAESFDGLFVRGDFRLGLLRFYRRQRRSALAAEFQGVGILRMAFRD